MDGATTLTPAIVDWYERKTQFLIDKYGPGPRIHYHTGLVPTGEPTAQGKEAISRQLIASQERMLATASEVWDAARHLRGEVVDVGCGLGGSALWFAEHGARVTGLTPVPGHVPVVERLAFEAGLADRVRVELGDAHTMPGIARFDAAYSFSASCYFDRARWFRHLRGLLRPGGRVFIEDSVYTRPGLDAPFDAYWLTHLGTEAEYVSAAHDAGFALVRLEDVSREAAGFWRVSLAHSHALLNEATAPEDIASRHRSIEWTTRLHEGYLDGGYKTVLFHFVMS